MPDDRLPLLAVLIDADNTSPAVADALFEEIAKYGAASVRRIYGDFSGTRLKGWAEIMPRYAIVPHQNFANTSGKNASDIALVIDAMDLLHSGRFDGFCLVSSDSDFTRLALRIREQGLAVYGLGRRTTPESFRQACSAFVFLENVTGASSETQKAGAEAGETQDPKDALPLLRRALSQLDDDEGWVHLGALGQRLKLLTPDFDPRTYGEAKLSDLVGRTGAFESAKRQNATWVRLKPTRSRSRRSAAKKA
jgi:hypothetical protein